MNLILHKLIPQRYHFSIAVQNVSLKTIKCGGLKIKGNILVRLSLDRENPIVPASQARAEKNALSWRSSLQ